jgi:hypothetical protein
MMQNLKKIYLVASLRSGGHEKGMDVCVSWVRGDGGAGFVALTNIRGDGKMLGSR